MVEKELVDRISLIGKTLKRNGIFLNLFALIKKDDSTENWDVVISSKSFDGEEKEIIELITQYLQQDLNDSELEKIARIVVLKPESPLVSIINSAVRVEDSISRFENSTFNNLLIKEMIIFSSIKS